MNLGMSRLVYGMTAHTDYIIITMIFALNLHTTEETTESIPAYITNMTMYVLDSMKTQ